MASSLELLKRLGEALWEEPLLLSSQVTKNGKALLVWCWEEGREWGLTAEVACDGTDPILVQFPGSAFEGTAIGPSIKTSGQTFDEL